jgi:hypothetical protein
VDLGGASTGGNCEDFLEWYIFFKANGLKHYEQMKNMLRGEKRCSAELLRGTIG